MTAAPAPARLPVPVLPETPDVGRSRAAGPGAAASRTGLDACLEVLRSGRDAGSRLRAALEALPLLVPGCDHVSVAARWGAGGPTGWASDEVAWRGDRLQDELDEGPGVQALRTGHGVLAPDLRAEGRWPGWCDRATGDLGLGSALSLLLTAGTRTSGTLTLYGDARGRLSGVDLGLLHAVAVPLGAALADVRRAA